MDYPIGIHVEDVSAGVDYQLNLNGYMQRFRVSREALEDFCGAPSPATREGLTKAFTAHLDRIVTISARKPGTPTNSVVILTTADFG